ncbi:uncharacterized protein LOC111864106 [Cryptotermes secundus]|uniref:uncharacterized protein LOC111864106 n=1 Tax=Cryptotermes secundus TaxID=105785 RepID=UPI000CD7AC7E|nr:uncharacterized protein LOC111864106 [Cryptotermes secundus]
MLQNTTTYNQNGELFYKQGRPHFFTKACVTLCLVRYKRNNAGAEFSVEFTKLSRAFQFPGKKSLHSEDMALSEIMRTEWTHGCAAITVELYSSFSPCEECCTLLQDFIKQRPRCRVFVAFTCVYRGGDRRHSCALQKLNGCSNVQLLDIFTAKEWRLLRDRQQLFLSPVAFHVTLMWDCYWRRKLIEILTISPQMAVNTGMVLGTVEPQTSDITTDGVSPSRRGLPDITDHYNFGYVATEDELKVMDDLVKDAMRREDRKHLILSVSLTVAIVAFFIYVLIHLV